MKFIMIFFVQQTSNLKKYIIFRGVTCMTEKIYKYCLLSQLVLIYSSSARFPACLKLKTAAEKKQSW